QAREEIKTLVMDEREKARRVDRLTYVVDEVGQANLKASEEETLKQERELLGNAELRANLADHAHRLLYGAGEDDKGALDLLNGAAQALTGLEKYDAAIKNLREQMDGAIAQADDLSRELARYRDSIDHNPKRLAQVDERMDLIFRLKRKYGDSIEEILKFAGDAAAELATITRSEERMTELKKKESELLKEIGALAAELSRARKSACEKLAREIENQLKDLGMDKAKFGVALERAADAEGVEENGKRVAVDTTGIDRVEFLVSPNPGEPLKPLAKIASGGETSRLMLAMKSVLAVADNTPTLIFDEIDQGIGGRTGGIVGMKLWALTPTAQKRDDNPEHQVLVITHLPQIAAYGDSHLKIHKEIVGERTITKVGELNDAQRVDEIANMLGTATATTRKNAEELLAETKSQKEKVKSKK
ncbi:MAG: DNA repair protein RecN, partial [Chloroflexi bacterium]|nr:DNA repair protein RecN [Chloroflexota bacterium]